VYQISELPEVCISAEIRAEIHRKRASTLLIKSSEIAPFYALKTSKSALDPIF